MNFRRKSTVGWSIGNILLDLLGGLTNYGQMAVQSIDQSMSYIPNFKLLMLLIYSLGGDWGMAFKSLYEVVLV